MNYWLLLGTLSSLILLGFSVNSAELPPAMRVPVDLLGSDQQSKYCQLRFSDSTLLLLDAEQRPWLTLGNLRFRGKENKVFAILTTAQPQSATISDRTDLKHWQLTYQLSEEALKRGVTSLTATAELTQNSVRLRFSAEVNAPDKNPGVLMLEISPLTIDATEQSAEIRWSDQRGTSNFSQIYADFTPTRFDHRDVVVRRLSRSDRPDVNCLIVLPGVSHWGTEDSDHLLFFPVRDGSYRAAIDFCFTSPQPSPVEPLSYARSYSLEIDTSAKDGFFPLGVLGDRLDIGFTPYIGGNYEVINFSPDSVFPIGKQGVYGVSIWGALNTRAKNDPKIKRAYYDNGKEQRDVCLFDPGTVEMIFEYARKSVAHAIEQGDERIFKWEIDNEYIPQLDYSPAAVEEFHKWLHKSYQGDLAVLNKAWHSEYSAFSEAIPPKLDEYAEKPAAFLDWSRFQQETFAEFLGKYYAVIYNADPRRRGVNGKDTQSSLEMQRIARTRRSNHELIGLAIAPYTGGVRGMDHYGHGDRNQYELNYYYHTIAPIDNQPGQRVGMLYGENNNHNGPGWQFAQTAWRTIPNGFRGGHFFCSGWFGCWGDWASFGFTNPDGTRRDKFYYLPRFYSMIHRAERFFTQSAIPASAPKVAILLPQRDIPFGVDDNISPWGFPINSRLRVYSRLRDAGYWVQVITFSKLAPEFMKDIQALFLVGAEHLSTEDIENIRNYVTSGGRIFTDLRTGAFDQHHLVHDTGLSDVLGVDFKEMWKSDDVVVDPGDVWFSTPQGNLVRGDGRVNYNLAGAEIVNSRHAFTVSNKTAILTKHKYGAGQAYWINTQFGTLRAESAVGEQPVVDWYRWLLTAAGVPPAYSVADADSFSGIDQSSLNQESSAEKSLRQSVKTTIPENIGEYLRVEIPIVDQYNNCFVSISGLTASALPPMSLRLWLPSEADFAYAFLVKAETTHLQKVSFTRHNDSTVSFNLPTIESAAALYLFRNHSPFIGLKVMESAATVAVDKYTAEFSPGDSFRVAVQIANPNQQALTAGQLQLRVLSDWTVSAAIDTPVIAAGELQEFVFAVTLPVESERFIPNFVYPLLAEFSQQGQRVALSHAVVSVAVPLQGRELLLSDNWSSENHPWAIWTGADYRYLTVADEEKKQKITDDLHATLGDNSKVYSLLSGDRSDRRRSARYENLPQVEVLFDLKGGYDITRLIIRRSAALESPCMIEAAVSADGEKFTSATVIEPQWLGNYSSLQFADATPGRYIKVTFHFATPNKVGIIDDVWIYGKLLADGSRGKYPLFTENR